MNNHGLPPFNSILEPFVLYRDQLRGSQVRIYSHTQPDILTDGWNAERLRAMVKRRVGECGCQSHMRCLINWSLLPCAG